MEEYLEYYKWKYEWGKVNRIITLVVFGCLVILGICTWLYIDYINPPVFLLNASTSDLLKIERQLKERPELKGKKLYLDDKVDFYNGYANEKIEIAIQDPGNPSNELDYKWNGYNWYFEGSIEVHNDSRYLYPMDSVSLFTAGKIAALYHRKALSVGAINNADKKGGENDQDLRELQFVYDPNHDSWHWDVIFPIYSKGKRYDIDFNRDGSLKSFNKEE